MYTDANGDGAEEMIDLGVFGGATSTNGHSINNMAQAAGHSADNNGFIYRAWRHSPLVGMEDLGVIKQNRGNIAESGASAINDAGDVVGWSTAGASKYHAFCYSDNSGMLDLGTLGGESSSATGINNQFGDVVGWAETADGVRHVFLYKDQSGMARVDVVGGLPGSLYHNVQAKINNLGEISGTLSTGDTTHEAFLLTPAASP